MSPGFPQTQPQRFTPDGGPGKLRPVSINIFQVVSVYSAVSKSNRYDSSSSTYFLNKFIKWISVYKQTRINKSVDMN